MPRGAVLVKVEQTFCQLQVRYWMAAFASDSFCLSRMAALLSSESEA